MGKNEKNLYKGEVIKRSEMTVSERAAEVRAILQHYRDYIRDSKAELPEEIREELRRSGVLCEEVEEELRKQAAVC